MIFQQNRKTSCLILLLLWGVSSGCVRNRDDGDFNVFHGAYSDDPKTLDPVNAYDQISLNLVPAIYETLYQYDYLTESYQIKPLLAADMPKLSSDRLTVTIPIRREVRFADDPCFKERNGKGRPLIASDFIYAWKRLALPKLQSGGWWIFDGKVAGINAFHDKLVSAHDPSELKKAWDDPIEGLRALDDFTIQIKLTRPYPQLQYILAMNFTSPVAREMVNSYSDPAGNVLDHAVGTGPFRLKSWERNRKIVLEKNPDFRPEFYPVSGADKYRSQGFLADSGKKLPFLDRIEMEIIKEAQPAWLKFLKGELDSAAIPKDSFQSAITQKSQLSPELAEKGIKLSIEPSTTFYFLGINMKDPVLAKNKKLRQAISSSIDRTRWIDLFTNGRGQKQLTALPPGIPDRPENPKLKYDFNIELAKQLLREAGYPDGKNLPRLKFELRGADSVSRQMGEFFQQSLSAVGIHIEIIANTFPAYLEKAKQGTLQLSYGGWIMDYPDAENVYQLLYGPNSAPGPNESNFNSPEMNQLYEKIAVLESGPERAKLISKMDDILQEEVPWALGYNHTEYRLSQGWLLNYRQNDIILNRFKYLRIDRDLKRKKLGKS